MFCSCRVRAAGPLPCEIELAKAAVPADAYYLPESRAIYLQHALNEHKIVRLKPNGDYRRGFSIQLDSDHALFGLAGTKTPAIIIAEGARNVIASGLVPEQISIAGSKAITMHNCFNRISNTTLRVKDANLEENLFTDLSNVKIDIDTSKKGYLKNNRFIRTLVHSAYPAIRIIGDPDKQSAGNRFIWTNILTPHGDGIIIENQQDISFVGLDAESWNWSRKARYPSMLNVGNTDFVSLFMPNGGDNKNKIGRYFNLDAKNILLQGMQIGKTQRPGFQLGSHTENLIAIDTQDIGLEQKNTSTNILEIFTNHRSDIRFNRNFISDKSFPEKIRSMLLTVLLKEKNLRASWEKPQFIRLPDPAGINWRIGLDRKSDTSDYIQHLLDTNGIVELPAGLYYLSKPLRLKNGQGIIGAGAERTALIAKHPDMDIIIGDDHINEKTQTTSFVLADLTLQGGRNGLNHSATGSGKGADYSRITLSHVAFRDMEHACIVTDNIYAWDNNFIDHSHFYRCNTAFKQTPDPSYSGGNRKGMTFLDKNVFYRCHFIDNKIAIDWPAKRANNLNGFIESQFLNNDTVIQQHNSLSTFFANSIIEINGSTRPIQSNRVLGFVNTQFLLKGKSDGLFDTNIYCDGCNFTSDLSEPYRLFADGADRIFMINSHVPQGSSAKIKNGLVLETDSNGQALTGSLNEAGVRRSF